MDVEPVIMAGCPHICHPNTLVLQRVHFDAEFFLKVFYKDTEKAHGMACTEKKVENTQES